MELKNINVPPNQRGVFPRAASAWIRSISKEENSDKIKNRIDGREEGLLHRLVK